MLSAIKDRLSRQRRSPTSRTASPAAGSAVSSADTPPRASSAAQRRRTSTGAAAARPQSAGLNTSAPGSPTTSSTSGGSAAESRKHRSSTRVREVRRAAMWPSSNNLRESRPEVLPDDRSGAEPSSQPLPRQQQQQQRSGGGRRQVEDLLAHYPAASPSTPVLHPWPQSPVDDAPQRTPHSAVEETLVSHRRRRSHAGQARSSRSSRGGREADGDAGATPAAAPTRPAPRRHRRHGERGTGGVVCSSSSSSTSSSSNAWTGSPPTRASQHQPRRRKTPLARDAAHEAAQDSGDGYAEGVRGHPAAAAAAAAAAAPPPQQSRHAHRDTSADPPRAARSLVRSAAPPRAPYRAAEDSPQVAERVHGAPVSRRSPSAPSEASMASTAAAGAALQREHGPSPGTRPLQVAWTAYLQRRGHLSTPERDDGSGASQPSPDTATTALGIPSMSAADAAKELLLLRFSLVVAHTQLSVAAAASAATSRLTRDVVHRYAAWTPVMEEHAQQQQQQQHRLGSPLAGHASRESSLWPALEARLTAAARAAADAVHDGDDGRTVTPLPPPPPQPLLLRSGSSAAAATGAAVDGLPELLYPPQHGSGRDGEDDSVSGYLSVWFSSGESRGGVLGTWRRCFVVADDRGVAVYPTSRDYAEHATERLLMAVPYTSLAYLIPDLAAAAAHVSAGECEPLAAVHAATIATVATQLAADGEARDGDNSGTCFGLLHRQSAATDQHAAAVAATRGGAVQGRQPRLSFAPWRVRDGDSAEYRDRPHAPLLLRTRTRVAHAEWVHFFASAFNEGLYELLFPITAAARTTRAADGSARRRQQRGHRHRRSVGAQPQRGHGRREPRHRRRGASPDHPARPSPSSANTNTNTNTSSSSSSSSTQAGDSYVGRAAHPREGGDDDDDDHAREPFTAGAGERWWTTMAALRRTLAERDQRLQDQATEMAALTKSLRQHSQRERDLEGELSSVRTALRDASDRIARWSTLEHCRPPGTGGAIAPAATRRSDSDVDASRTTAASASHRRHVLDPHAFGKPATPSHESNTILSLEAQLSALERHHAADTAAWQAERTALHQRCRTAEEQLHLLQHRREGSSGGDNSRRALARQVVHDLDDYHREMRSGAQACVAAMKAERARSTSNSNSSGGGGGSDSVALALTNTPPRGRAVTPAAADTRDGAFASLLLRFDPEPRRRTTTRAGAVGACVDGELVVDEAQARLLFSGPTAGQRGRRWELRHHDTDAMLRVELELVSQARGDSRRGATRSPSAAPRPSGASPPSPPSPPPSWSMHAYDQKHSHHYQHHSVSTAAVPRDTLSPLPRMHLTSVLRKASVEPRPTRASLLRQSAIEEQIHSRDAKEDGGGVFL
ncbi:hypothetical protein NESM_000833200 [Novymonas esmeraldas]|uniref:PH domain-containing protein n=1 Tax=Novymonas esmeraldas TaxID=1808958 RepID=A0AAW0EZF4_9TRYP